MITNRFTTPLPAAQPLPEGKRPTCEPCAACAARSLSVCNAIDDGDLARLAAITTSFDLEAHKTFISEGDPADHLFNITDGAVKVYKLLADGRQQITGFLFAGDFLGLSAHGRYVYSAEALSAVRYCRFPQRKLEQLLTDFPQMEKRLLNIASNELAAAQDQMLLLGRKTAREKVASFLMMLSNRAVRLGRPADPVMLPMTRADIGDYLGLTIETVSRTMTQLRNDKIISLVQVNEVHLIDRNRLSDVADGN